MQPDSTTSLRRWSELHGLAVVTIDTGKKEGTVGDFAFDPTTNAVYALILKTGVMSQRALLTKDISAIGLDAVTVANEDTLIKEHADPKLDTLTPGRNLLSYRVLSEGGNVIGTVGNILFDTTEPTRLYVAAFELTGGLRDRLSGHYPRFASNTVIRYGQDVIVIPDTIAVQLLEK